MKFNRIVALIMALMLSTFCFAAFAEDEYPIHEPILLSGMELTAAEWLADGDTRALFSLLLQLEMAIYEEEYHMGEYLEVYGLPTQYVAINDSDPAFTFLEVFYFFNDGVNGVMVVGLYMPDYGMFNGFVMDYAGDPVAMMESFLEGGSITGYYEITLDEMYNAYVLVDSVINGN